ncbi:hypothetical protein CP533_4079 [Ophiocordyceps camponoti-saundersi (nom. inval.)]|nr:hypothetical protein CP533_4079 [Ophiocordyceps camponoti-saundersi (nom. inval.)]
MTIKSPDVEILVHITAPSTTTDDVAYRDLGRAYLSFEAKSRIRLADGEGEASSFSGLELESSPALSFRSVVDNRASPRLKKKKGDENQGLADVADPCLSSSFCSPPSQIVDSYPLPGKDFCHASPTRVLEHYLSSTRSIGSSPLADHHHHHVPSSLPEQVVFHVPSSIPDPALGRDEEEEVLSLVGDDVPQVIPVTPMLVIAPAAVQARGEKRKNDSPDEIPWPFDVTHISSSPLSPSSFQNRAESEPPPPPPPPPPLPPFKKRKLSIETETDPTPKASNAPSPPLKSPQATTELEIIPPSPPVGSATIDPSSLASEKLLKLAQDLSSRYRPNPPSRAVDPLERGYWLVDCTAWPADERAETWVFLSNYLGSGLAGWGVWCRRSVDPVHDSIRLYCWACVAKHTYLLLYLASGRRVKASGASWYDAEGVVVIEVPPSGRHVT